VVRVSLTRHHWHVNQQLCNLFGLLFLHCLNCEVGQSGNGKLSLQSLAKKRGKNTKGKSVMSLKLYHPAGHSSFTFPFPNYFVVSFLLCVTHLWQLAGTQKSIDNRWCWHRKRPPFGKRQRVNGPT